VSTVSAFHALSERPSGQHPLHGVARAWPETNCYVDLWIELLHALRLDPLACLGFTFSTDFEGDQWTFFKPPLGDLLELYGVDVQELSIWRPFVEHVCEQIARKRLVVVEVDSYFLPDTVATDYRKNHTKTTIAIETIDVENQRIGYFHNAVYHELEGEDYVSIFKPISNEQTGASRAELPPYTEFVKLDRLVRCSREELALRAARIIERELARRPKDNPLTAFRERFPVDLQWLLERDLNAFHAYAFATLRQVGACFELAGEHLRWLNADDPAHQAAARSFDEVASGAKTVLFKIARVVNARGREPGAPVKKPSFDEALAAMESAWSRGMDTIASRYGA